VRWLSYLLPRLALLVVAVALPAGGGELYLRWFRPVLYRMPAAPVPDERWRGLVHRRSDIPGLSYELAPGRRVVHLGAGVQTNRMGLRSYEPLPASDERVRIAVVGDSYAFGFGVQMRDTFASVLERGLNTRAGRRPDSTDAQPPDSTVDYEVMNFGVGGYSTLDEAAVVEHRVRPWAPALIVLAYSMNDPEDAPIQPVHSFYSEVEPWQHSHLLRFVALTALRHRIRRHGDGDYHRYLHRSPDKWATVQRGFARIARVAAQLETPVLVAIFPHCIVDLWAHYPLREQHRQVADEARSHGFLTLDLLPAMEQQHPRRVRLSRIDDHPNAMGHRLAGEQLITYLRETELLDE